MSFARFDPQVVDVSRLLRSLGIEGTFQDGQWKALCPAHSDSKPSWSIVDNLGGEKNTVHACWSCGFRGDAIGLVKEVLGLSTFSVARDWVIEHATGSPPPVFGTPRMELVPRKAVLREPKGIQRGPLQEWAAAALEYIKTRSITTGQAARWSLGYALDGALAGRIFIPTKDAWGRLVSYTARTYVGSPMRYRMPKKDENPDAGAVFGEQHWPIKRRRVYVTEGAFNALAVERAVGGVVAALSGSNLHMTQVMKLSTFSEVVVVTDPDLAGDKAAAALSGALARHVQSFRRVSLPPKTDANKLPVEELQAALAS